jgi:hypothetical protein
MPCNSEESGYFSQESSDLSFSIRTVAQVLDAGPVADALVSGSMSFSDIVASSSVRQLGSVGSSVNKIERTVASSDVYGPVIAPRPW